MARVLIVVERDPEVGEWVKEVLARIGHQAPMATNRAVGLRLLDSVAPDLVITDVLRPEMDRLEAFHRLYDRPGPKIIALCEGKDAPDLHSTARTLARPFTEASLISLVETMLAGG